MAFKLVIFIVVLVSARARVLNQVAVLSRPVVSALSSSIRTVVPLQLNAPTPILPSTLPLTYAVSAPVLITKIAVPSVIPVPILTKTIAAHKLISAPFSNGVSAPLSNAASASNVISSSLTYASPAPFLTKSITPPNYSQLLTINIAAPSVITSPLTHPAFALFLPKTIAASRSLSSSLFTKHLASAVPAQQAPERKSVPLFSNGAPVVSDYSAGPMV